MHCIIKPYLPALHAPDSLLKHHLNLNSEYEHHVQDKVLCAGWPESRLLRDMAFGLLQSTVQAAVPRYRFAQIPKSVSSLI